jgi:hypothetical protein
LKDETKKDINLKKLSKLKKKNEDQIQQEKKNIKGG